VVRGDGVEDGSAVGPVEGQLTRAHAVEDAAEAEQVAAVIDLFAGGLLRGHVLGRAGDGPVHRQGRLATDQARQAEVEDLHPPALPLQPDVGRLDVAVDQPLLVGRRQPLGDFAADAEGVGQRQRPLALQPVLQRLAFEQHHGQEEDTAVLADLVDGDDVVVLDGGGHLRLALEAAARVLVGGQRGPHGLEGDRPPQLQILRQKDNAHAAGAELAQDAVRPEPADLVGGLRRGQEVVRLGRGGGREGRVSPRAAGHLPGLAAGRGQPADALDQRLDRAAPRQGVRRAPRPAHVLTERVLRRQRAQGLRAAPALLDVPRQRLHLPGRQVSSHEPAIFVRFGTCLVVHEAPGAGKHGTGAASPEEGLLRRRPRYDEYAGRRAFLTGKGAQGSSVEQPL
jgi:hypothetical protein